MHAALLSSLCVCARLLSWIKCVSPARDFALASLDLLLRSTSEAENTRSQDSVTKKPNVLKWKQEFRAIFPHLPFTFNFNVTDGLPFYLSHIWSRFASLTLHFHPELFLLVTFLIKKSRVKEKCQALIYFLFVGRGCEEWIKGTTRGRVFVFLSSAAGKPQLLFSIETW